MKSLWNDKEASQYHGDLAQRVYTSRLLGRDTSLVMHGGGNTSVKITERNIVGEQEEILYVKGSGWDLETIEAPGFSPVRMKHLLALSRLEVLSDTQMANELGSNMTRVGAPAPSVEAILHAILPHKFVDHTHADAIISITNTPDGSARIQEIYGNSVVVIPYVMPGFKLARLCEQMFPAAATDQTIGMVLLNHGIFSFGATAQESYDRMIALVDRAEQYLKQHNAWQIAAGNIALPTPTSADHHELAALRQRISSMAGQPMLMKATSTLQTMAFANRPNVLALSQQGPATPDHVIRTKRTPLVGRDIDAYQHDYEAYFEKHAAHAGRPLNMLDPAPRVILDPTFGLLTIGRTAKETRIAQDIYEHTMSIILSAEALGGWRALPPEDIFDVEYWDLEQAKLKKSGKAPVFTGEIGLVTGAASGIGKACAESLLARGAAVVGLDINPAITTTFTRSDYLGLVCDVTDEKAIEAALNQTLQTFGGLDMLVLNAGIFPPSKRIEALPLADWERTLRINLNANLILMSQAYPLLKLAPQGGRVSIIASKNVPAPGPGQAAYSASKAALTQLARVAALEWGGSGIRVNMLHPNAVFDTGLWTEETLKARAENYKMSVEDYKRNNVLGITITSHDVGELAAELCGPLFSCTTGAQIPIDGGNERVI